VAKKKILKKSMSAARKLKWWVGGWRAVSQKKKIYKDESQTKNFI